MVILAVTITVIASSVLWAGYAWGQGSPGQDADDWTGTPEQKVVGLARIWAQAKYAFPSFGHVPELNWDQSFHDFIPRVIAAKDRDEYYWTLMEFAGLLNDGHTSVLPYWGYLRPDYDNPPLEVQVIDGAFLVARAADTPELSEQGIVPGVEILTVDGVDVRTHFEDSVNRYYPRGSAHANEAVNIVYMLRGPREENVALTVRDAEGTEREAVLTRSSMLPEGGPFLPRVLLWMMSGSAMEVKELPEGAMYVRISNFEDPAMTDTFRELIDSLEDGSAGLVLDLRFCLGGRGNIAERMIGALIEEPVSSPVWRYPRYIAAERNWGRVPEWGEASNTIQPRQGKRYAGPVVVLTAGTTSSTAEDFAISLRTAGRAVLVGERTAGSAGNPVDVPLPGGGRFEMATFRAYLPDGDEYVGTGVSPDVDAAPTRQDLRTGRDSVLERALEVLSDWDSYAD